MAKSGYTRRSIIQSVALATAGASLTNLRAKAADAAPRKLIDTHHHYISPAFAAAKGDLHLKMAPSTDFMLRWAPAQSIDEMDRAGIELAVLSLGHLGTWFGDVQEGRRISREVNEFAARAVSDHPGRFAFFASIPLPDTDGSLEEIDYIYKHLKPAGINLVTSYDDKYLGDESFSKVLAELNRRHAFIYVHPRSASCCHSLDSGIPAPFLEFPFDTTRTITDLMFSGRLAATPDIVWLFSHGGGTIPMLAGRIEGFARANKRFGELYPSGFMAELSKLYYDTANVTTAPAFAGLSKLVPNSQILFGSDYPFLACEPQIAALTRLGLDEAQLAAIYRGNAQRLLSRQIVPKRV
jgi:predicted TIM-barrel fold metal-dependent hydrolase